MSASRQIIQASKQTIKNEQCRSNPPKSVPQANSRNTWALARQGGYLLPIPNWEQKYATLWCVPSFLWVRNMSLGCGPKPYPAYAQRGRFAPLPLGGATWVPTDPPPAHTGGSRHRREGGCPRSAVDAAKHRGAHGAGIRATFSKGQLQKQI